MRLRAIALLAAALAALASGSVRAEPAGPGTFLELRVCTYETFVLKTKRCGRDQRSDALVSSRFGCSVRFVVRRRVVFREVMRYAGARAVVLEATLGPGRYRYWMSESTYSRFPLPGGAWSCSYELGSVRASVRFRSGGPTGDIVNTAACAFSHALRDVDGLYGFSSTAS